MFEQQQCQPARAAIPRRAQQPQPRNLERKVLPCVARQLDHVVQRLRLARQMHTVVVGQAARCVHPDTTPVRAALLEQVPAVPVPADAQPARVEQRTDQAGQPAQVVLPDANNMRIITN